MTLKALLQAEPVHYLYRDAQPGETDSEGVAITKPVLLRPMIGRLNVNSGRQTEMWLALSIECDYGFQSEDDSVENGMFIMSADGRLFRVVGTGEKSYGKGRCPTNLSYALKLTSTK